ncbi:hypothetical protein HID58_004529 [Brassica napus]|uniref:GPI inositol-deacylase n=1 Tax=Brassica napus TaxID=3708 RepID=A0ABQ8E6K0_BRANA|nr:hypothetical protein HID58_004529 [Brassica napus]
MASAIFPSLRLRPTFSSATSPSSSGDFKPRPAVILPFSVFTNLLSCFLHFYGLGNNSGDYKKLEVTLGEYGVPSVVAAVSRLDWFRNAAGKGLSLIGHSAGGWLARVYMEEYGNADISLLLTLGTPHLPPPRGLSGVIDQTRGLLYYVEENCAKAVYTPELRYVCIAGRYIRGAPLVDKADANVDSDVTVGIEGGEAISELALASNKTGDSSGPSFRARFVGQGYKQVCGRANVWGDGVVPEVSAHLEGALNVSFEGVYHSPVGSDDATRPWYGSPHLVSLKSLSLNGCKHLENLPDSLLSLTCLETLEVSGCLNINEFPRLAKNIEVLRISETSINEVPARICDLSQLRSLDISGNEKLKSLPVSISELRSLEKLKLSGCCVLESLPPEICQTMSCLRWLDLERTSIKELPENIGNLIALEVLQAGRTAIRRAPLSIARLERLQVLAIGNSFYTSQGLHSLCPHLSIFNDLRALCLSNMNMIEIPNSIGNLWSLSELDLSGNNFEHIPASIRRLTRLSRLDVNNCQRLQALPDDLPRRLLYIYAHGCTSLVSISGCFKPCCLRKLVASNCYKLDQEAQILIHRNMKLDAAKPEHSYFPGRDVPSCFNHQAMGSSLRIRQPSSDILGFSACIMIGVDGEYSMNDLKIRCSCILKRVDDAQELVVMDELWYPDPKAFANMSFGSDHLLLFSRSCMSMGAYNEVFFEFSIENTNGDSSTNLLVEVKKCAVHLITFKDMLQEEHESSSSSQQFSNDDNENIHDPDLEELDEAGVPKRRPDDLHKEQPNPKKIKFLPVPSKLHQLIDTPQ